MKTPRARETREIKESREIRIVRTLTSAQVLVGIGVAGTGSAGSLLVSRISNSESLAGLAQTTAVLGAAAMAIPLSRLTQIGGRRLALSTGYLTGSLGAITAVFGGKTSNLFLMLLGTLLVGAAAASGYQARFAAVDLATPETRSRKLSIVVWGSTVGAVAGPNLMDPSGSIAEYFNLPRLVGPYLLALVTLVLAALVVLIFLRPDPYLTLVQERHLEGAKNISHSVKETFTRIKQIPSALFAIASIAIGHFAMVSVMVMTPVHMAHFHDTLKIIGVVISIHIAGMFALSPIVGYLSDHFGRRRVIQIGVVIFLLAGLVAGRSEGNNTVGLGCGLFLLGLGWSFTLIGGSTLLAESVEDEIRSSSQGTSDLVMNLVGAGGGALAGVIIALLSYGWLCLIVSLPVFALGLWSLRISQGVSRVKS